jgi:hypothetical protein
MTSAPAARRRFFPDVPVLRSTAKGESGILAKDNEPIFCFRYQQKAKRDLNLKEYQNHISPPPKSSLSASRKLLCNTGQAVQNLL